MSKNKKIALRGVLIAFAMILSYIESFIPTIYAVPGVKIGLANIVTIMALLMLSVKDAAVISVLRIVLSGLIFSNVTTILYSLAGAACSILFMWLAKKSGLFKTVGISVIGGVFHNVGQIIVAAIMLYNMRLVYYLLILVVSGTISGIIIGVISGVIMKYIDLDEYKS